jgi:hypothetical protein
MKKYIVNLSGTTTSNQFSFERSMDFYEKSDEVFISKLIRVIDFKNQDIGSYGDVKYHAEFVKSVIVVNNGSSESILSEEDFEKFVDVSKRKLEKLSNVWFDEYEFDSGVKLSCYAESELEERLGHSSRDYFQEQIDRNLLIH